MAVLLLKRSWGSMAPIEAEATGIGWAVEHCSYDLKGSDKVVTIVTNHYPLVAVFDKCASPNASGTCALA